MRYVSTDFDSTSVEKSRDALVNGSTRHDKIIHDNRVSANGIAFDNCYFSVV